MSKFNLSQYVQDFSRAWQVRNFDLPGTQWDYMTQSELFPGYLAPMRPVRLDLLSAQIQMLQNAETDRQEVLARTYRRYSPSNLEINLMRPFW